MSVQYIQKKSAGTESSPTAIGDDTTGKAIVRNFSRAAGFVFDRAANLMKYNGNDAVKTLVSTDDTQTLTNKTITGAINSDIKALAADFLMVTGGVGSTLADITGFSFTVIAAGVYKFRLNIPAVTMTTNGGLKLAFKLTTATLTAVQLRVRSSTDTDNTGAVSASFATTTDQATWVDQKAVVYTNIQVEGYLVVLAAGTISVQAAQNTAHADTTTISKGATVELIRLS